MKTIALAGVGGLVGDKTLQLLQANLAGRVNLRLFGRSEAGKRVQFGGKWVTVEPLDRLIDGDIDYALFTATEEISAKYVPPLAQCGTVCIDNSAVFRLSDGVPLVVPSVNGRQAKGNIIANPNCVTIPVAMVVNALMDLAPTKVSAVTYQAASGGGKEGLADLVLRRKNGRTKCFETQIFDNVLPLCGKMADDGRTTEEHKLTNELPKILGMPGLAASCFCVRVPVTVGHSVVLNVTFDGSVTTDEVKERLAKATDVLLFAQNVPTPLTVRNTKYVAAGRVVQETDNCVTMFVTSDNLLRGAAYNAYEILRLVLDGANENKDNQP